jgi:hypothetical protein
VAGIDPQGGVMKLDYELNEESKEDAVATPLGANRWDVTHTFTVSKEMMGAMEIGQDVDFCVKGKVTGLNSSEELGKTCCRVTLVASSIELESGYDEEESFEKGFSKGPKRY